MFGVDTDRWSDMKFTYLEDMWYAPFTGDYDVRCFVPPEGYLASAELIDVHPESLEDLEQAVWFIFLKEE